MSRSGYSDDNDNLWQWRGVIASATRGKRGQRMFRDLRAALEAMPEKKLVAGTLENKAGEVCALGALGNARGVDVAALDTYNWQKLGKAFDIAPQLAQEVMFMNDEAWWRASDEERWTRVHQWVCDQIRGDD